MVLFPWIVLLVVLLLLAELLLGTPGAMRGLRAERRLHFVRPAIRAVLMVMLVELVIVLVWAIILRPR